MTGFHTRSKIEAYRIFATGSKAILVAATLFVVAATTPHALAQPARKWVQSTQADFESGKRNNIALTSIGQMKLARRESLLIEEAGDHVWDIVTDSRGVTYVATGSSGRIYKIENGESKLFYDSEEAEILSLAVDKNDNLYAGTAPGGLIYRFDTEGNAVQYFDSAATYVWGLALDSKGTLYAATGDTAALLKITGRNEGAAVFETDKPHLLDTAVDSKDNAYVCTSQGGLVYRIDPAGKAFALLDTQDEEMHKLVIDDNDNVYVCTADGMQPGIGSFGQPGPANSGGPLAEPGPAEGKEPNPADGGSGPEEGMPQQAPPNPQMPPEPRQHEAVTPPINGINFVYKITPQGKVTSIFRREGMAVLSLATQNDEVYIGTGNRGQLLKIGKNLDVTILTQVEQPQIAALDVAPDGTICFGTAAQGKLYQMSNGLASEGTYTSMVKDLNYPPQSWGVLRPAAELPDGTAITVETRSGNTADPDKTWSDWQQAAKEESGYRIAGPAGRFLQYRLKLQGKNDATPLIRSVEAYYLPPNYRPRISAINFPAPQGGGSAPPPLTGSVSATQKAAVAPLRQTADINWNFEDPNGDLLAFSAYFKGVSEQSWKKIADKLNQAQISWNTIRVPDGVYRLKVQADDSPSNPPARALSTEEISEPFLIDNTPPTVSQLQAEADQEGRVEVSAKLFDKTSPIQDAVYSVDSGDWVMLAPADGIFDSAQETISFTTDKLEPGEHTVVINTRDAAGNIGAGKTTIVVRAR